jgi:hypothetical protein
MFTPTDPYIVGSGGGVSITYKVARYVAGYDLAIENNNYEYNAASNYVSVRTENIDSKINNQIKTIWGKPPLDTNLAEVVDYFSPIVYNLGLRFS